MNKILVYNYLNVLKHYREFNGYVLKVLGYTEDLTIGKRYLEGISYTDRERTSIPVIDGDFLIVMKYSGANSTYVLIQADAAVANGFKYILECTETKHEIKKYLIENKLIVKMNKEKKSPQIVPIYADFIEEKLMAHSEREEKFTCDAMKEFLQMNNIYEGMNYSLEDLKKLYTSCVNKNQIDRSRYAKEIILLCSQAMSEVPKIYELTGKETLTIQEAIEAARVCSENYTYNL